MVEDEKKKLILLLGNKHYPDRGIFCLMTQFLCMMSFLGLKIRHCGY